NPPPGPDGQEIAMVGVDCAIIMNPKVWEASGHVGGFADPMVDCKKCRRRFRADKVYFGAWVPKPPIPVPLQANASSGGMQMGLPHYYQSAEADNAFEAEKEFTEETPRLLKKRLINDMSQLVVRSAKDEPLPLWRRPCPEPGCDGDLTAPRFFNLMFES